MTTSSAHPETTDVLVVGAGPTGLVAAVRLAQLGISSVVLDARAEPTSTSNAALVHASTLELFRELGLADAAVAAGRIMHRIVMIDRGRPLVRVALAGLPTDYPFALGLPQSTTEELLIGRLHTLHGSVRRQHRVTAVVQDGEQVVVTGVDESGPTPAPFELRARYVIGADGSRSAVRAALGLELRGETYEDEFVLADVRLDSEELVDDQATIYLSPLGVTVLGLLPSGNHRMVATAAVAGGSSSAPDRAFVDELLQERRIAARTADDPVWSSRFRIHHRVADRFRIGSVFLAGDAAHVHSPAAGQGMNTGVADAFDIATRLAAVVRHVADPVDLDAYEQHRRAAALEVLAFTHRMTRMSMLQNPVARSVRRLLMSTVGRRPKVQRTIAMWVTGLQRSPLRTDLPVIAPGRAAVARLT